MKYRISEESLRKKANAFYLRYGLGYTYTKIGKRLGVTKQRAHQMIQEFNIQDLTTDDYHTLMDCVMWARIRRGVYE